MLERTWTSSLVASVVHRICKEAPVLHSSSLGCFCCLLKAFGAPTIVIEDAKNQKQLFFGSDRMELLASFLGRFTVNLLALILLNLIYCHSGSPH